MPVWSLVATDALPANLTSSKENLWWTKIIIFKCLNWWDGRLFLSAWVVLYFKRLCFYRLTGHFKLLFSVNSKLSFLKYYFHFELLQQFGFFFSPVLSTILRYFSWVLCFMTFFWLTEVCFQVYILWTLYSLLNDTVIKSCFKQGMFFFPS